MSGKIRVGIIGCGGIAQMMHIPHIMETPSQFELVALADNNQAVLHAVADRYHISKRYTSWQELLQQDDVDAVLICHGGSHRDSVLDALEAEKHVLVEKPLAWNLREVREIAARAARSNRVVQVGYHKLYDPGFRYARQELQAFEDLAYAECTVLHAADEFNRAPYAVLRGKDDVMQFDYQLPDWESMVSGAIEGFSTGTTGALQAEALGELSSDGTLQAAFGMLTISVIHQIYTLFGFLGEPVKVLRSNFWRGGNSMNIMFAYPDDVHAVLNWHNLPFLNDYRETYAFYGNHRRMRLEFPGPYYRNFPSPVVLQGGEGELVWEKKVTVSYREAFHNELLEFGESIRTGKKPVSTVDDAVRHAMFIEEMIRASIR